MADLKKLFVYVPSASEDTFVKNVIGSSTEAAKYSNKIVFLEKSKRLWVKGVYYGGDNETVTNGITSLWKSLGLTAKTDGTSSFSKTLDGTTYTDLVKYLDALSTKNDNAHTALEAKLPAVAVSGSGLSLTTTTDEKTGKKTYTVVADQSIWEFMGTAEATKATVATVLDGKYPVTPAGGTARAKEAGDVWSVTLTDDGNNTVLYAWDGSAWVRIGASTGVTNVDTTASHGIGLTFSAGVVGLGVTTGSVAASNNNFPTGGAVYTAIQNEHTAAYSYAGSEAAKAQANAYSYAKGLVDDHKKAAVKSVAVNTADASYLSFANTAAADGVAYTLSLDESNVFNYISDNMWETYGA